MQIERFPIDGVLLITPTKRLDPRGFFSEVYRSEVFAAEGIAALQRGTLSVVALQTLHADRLAAELKVVAGVK